MDKATIANPKILLLIKSKIFGFAIVALSISFLAHCATAPSTKKNVSENESLVTVPSRANIEQKFLLIKPENPTAAVILFAGGHGGLRLTSLFGMPAMAWGAGNFLVRTRKLFADHGFVVAVIDSPPDHKQMDAIWRMSPEHAEDIHAVVRALKKDFNLPVWVIGTSMGTFSAPNAAIRLGSELHGLVLTSSVTISSKKWDKYSSHPNAVIDMDLGKVVVPTLIIAHKDDGCELTPASNSEKLKNAFTNAPTVEVKYFTGGKMPISEPCHAKSQHGFYGIEDEVVSSIADFINSN